jgi:hypothetical protein
MKSCDVIGRVSKGVGLPGALPDIAGLVWRMPPDTIFGAVRRGMCCWPRPSPTAASFLRR